MNWHSQESLKLLFEALTGNPETSAPFLRFVGGSVRDYFLKTAFKDIDLATSFKPETVIQKLKAAQIPYLTTGLSHGTVTALLENKTYEITTLRRDLNPDGRHTAIDYTESWVEDAMRRDFTINALYMDWKGIVYDFVGGRKDLLEGRIRFVGAPERRVQEDFLRILRLFRMFAFYGKAPLEKQTLEAVQKFAPQLKKLSRERIHHEFLRLLEAPDPENALRLMEEKRVLKQICIDLKVPPFFKDLIKIEGQFQNQRPKALLRCAALLLLAPQQVIPSLRKFLIKTQEIRYVSEVLVHKEFLLDLEPLKFSRSFLYKVGLNLHQDLMMLKAAILSRQGKSQTNIFDQIQNKAEEVFPTLKFPLSGKLLLEKGISPGPFLGRLLKEIEAFWLEKECFLSKEEGLAYLRKRMREK